MLKEYTTRKIIELSEECGHDKKWMKRLWIPKKQGEEQVQSHLKPCRMLGASHEKENKKMEKITEKDCFRSRKECFDDDNCSKCPIWIKEQKQGE